MSQPVSTKGKAKAPAKKLTTEGGPAPKPSTLKKFMADDCILAPVSIGGPYIGGKKLGTNSDVTVTLTVSRRNHENGWIGIVLGFPLGKDNENDGFGVRYKPEPEVPEKANTCVTFSHDIKIKFPRGQYKVNISDIAGSNQLDQILRDHPRLCCATVTLAAPIQVEGFGLPFANPGHPSHKWVNEDVPIVGEISLSKILQQREFVLLVSLPDKVLRRRLEFELGEPFAYPYGNLYLDDWNPAGYQKCIEAAPGDPKGQSFMPRFSFENDNEMLTAMTQGAFQEAFFLDQTVEGIADIKLPGYFVRKSDSRSAYVVIARPENFVQQYEPQWPRLCSDDLVKVWVRPDWETDVAPPTKSKKISDFRYNLLKARALKFPAGIPALADHAKKEYPHDLILEVSLRGEGVEESKLLYLPDRLGAETKRNCVSLIFRSDMDNARRRVDAVLSLRRGADPTCTVNMEHLHRRMALQRDVMRGGGSYETLSRPKNDLALDLSELQLEDDKTKTGDVRLLAEQVPFKPITNLLANMDPQLADAIVDLALPEDRSRFRNYLEHRHLGIGTVAAPGGTGKTTALCAAGLAMIFNKNIGSIFGSGPTNVAVSNCAERLYWTGVTLTDRFNAGKEEDAQVQRPLVVRGYKLKDECKAFWSIMLGRRVPDDDAISIGRWSPAPAWKYALSPCNWLLVALGYEPAESSPVKKAVKTVHDRDHPVLLEIRRELEADQLPPVQRFLRLVRGEINAQEYQGKETIQGSVIEKYMLRIISCASAVLTTPACAYVPPPSPGQKEKSEADRAYEDYKIRAGGVLVDEAGCMVRSDLLSVWGNTLRPLFMAGDTKQLTPPDMEPLNRFSLDLTNSALNFFQGSGLPVYRLRVQLRMCNDQFGLARRLVYKDIDGFHYGPSSDPSLDLHAMGRDFENFLVNVKKFPGLKASPAGTIQPVFMHVPGSFVSRQGTSKLNRDQVVAALELLSEFVKHTGHNPGDVVVICPYKANVEFGNRIVSRYEALAGLPKFQTADSFQGQEGKMAVVVFGTNKSVGPGFTASENRLNVMITRQQSALLLVGDKMVTGDLEGKGAALATKNAAKGARSVGPDGEVVFTKSRVLRDMLLDLHSQGRFFDFSPTTAPDAKDNDDEVGGEGEDDSEGVAEETESAE
ncbi:hypothetical protein V8F20_010733 [Naviculisporaceae sp. PSN 640]